MSHTLAYILHTRPWRETSLLVDALTQDFGRIALIAKGAKRPHSPLRGLLEPFTPITVQFSGKLGVKNLTHAHWVFALAPLHPAHTMQGWYLNELCLRTLGEDDPQPAVFAAYDHAVQSLLRSAPQLDTQAILRTFESALLYALGLWPDARFDAAGQALQADSAYTLDESVGWVMVQAQAVAWYLTGAQIAVLSPPSTDQMVHSAPQLSLDKQAATGLRRAMRALLSRALNGTVLSTREVWKTLDALEQRYPSAASSPVPSAMTRAS